MSSLSEKKLRFFCPMHGVGSQSVAQTRIICERGNHEFEDDFPFSGKWIYCFDCQRFYPGDVEKKSKFPHKNCLCCERQVKKRFLCPECLTFYIETDNADKKESFIGENEQKLSVCLACRKNIGGITSYLHNCRTVSAEFYIANIECPFCKSSIFGEKFLTISKAVSELINLNYSLNMRLSTVEKQLGDLQRLSAETANTEKTGETIHSLTKKIYAELLRQEQATENKIRLLESNLNEAKTQNLAVVSSPNVIIRCIHCEGEVSAAAKFCPYCGKHPHVLTDKRRAISSKKHSKLFPDSVSNILNISSERHPLIRYPLVAAALKLADNKSDLSMFYLISEQSEDVTKKYVIPSLPRITVMAKFNVYTEFYSIDWNTLDMDTATEIFIVEPAEIYWDEIIKGFRLRGKGSIKFV